MKQAKKPRMKGFCFSSVFIAVVAWIAIRISLLYYNNEIVNQQPGVKSYQNENERYQQPPFQGDSGESHSSMIRMSMENVTCHDFIQPLDHFSSSTSRTFPQRYCVYDGYVKNSSSTSPIFFYTGNESPIDEYVNNTGLLWELAAKPHFSALVVFAEHRFQGTSVNYTNLSLDGEACFTHLTTNQALYDYVSLLNYLNPNQLRPVIVFGGSYGGMLSSWMRIKYPSIVAGAIASSAPIWGFPKTLEYLQRGSPGSIKNRGGIAMDGASRVVARALALSYPPNETHTEEENYCPDNLLAAWPLMEWYSRSETGRAILSRSLSLCHDLQFSHQGRRVIEWAQSPWFDLAEGDYPYPSSYIPFALGEGLAKLPSWPLQAACHSAGLHQNLGINFVGNKSSVNYSIIFGEEGDGELKIDWDQLSSVDDSKLINNPIAERLLVMIKDAVSVWFNVTGKVDCFDVIPAINTGEGDVSFYKPRAVPSLLNLGRNDISASKQRRNTRVNEVPQQVQGIEELCREKIENETVWSSIVCNENLNLIMTYAKGLGNDFYWPPSHPKDKQAYEDTIADREEVETIYNEQCDDRDGMYGYPKSNHADPLSNFMDNYYGGVRLGASSNIIFSNGLLDPWTAAGVFRKDTTEETFLSSLLTEKRFCQQGEVSYKCSMVQNITADGSIIAVFLDLGGHHLDLMFSSHDDPPCAPMARAIQEVHISKWLLEWKEGSQIHGRSCESQYPH